MTKDELLALADRCEAATGPDRELDAEIDIAVRGFPEKAYWQANSMRGKGRRGLSRIDWLIKWGADRYTASIDAATALVPEGLDPQICKGPMFALAANEKCPWGVSLIGNARDVEGEFGLEMDYDSFDANAATAPLAVCAAALRARASQEAGDE